MPRPGLAGMLLACLILSIAVSPAAAAGGFTLFEDIWQLSPLNVPNNAMIDIEGANIDYNPFEGGDGGLCIIGAKISLPPNSQADITLYDFHQVITGHVNTSDSAVTQDLYWSLNGDEYHRFNLNTPLQGGASFHIHTWTTSAFNETATTQGKNYVGLSDTIRGNHGTPLVPLNAALSRISVTASEPVSLVVWVAPVSDYYDATNAQRAGEFLGGVKSWTDILLSLADGILRVVSMSWYIFKTVFIDNFLLFFGLFEAVGLAYAANKSRDIFQFFRKIVNYNATVFRAMVWLIEKIVTILQRVISAINPLG